MEIKDFEIVKLIGEGGFGRVYLGINKNENALLKKGQVVAIKIIPKQYFKSIEKETKILKSIQGRPFLSQLITILADRTAAFLLLRFEENASLREFIANNTLRLSQVRDLTIDIVLGLEFLHSRYIIHGDMKPDNILLDARVRAQIADFGISIVSSRDKMYVGSHGTKGYRSPEQLSNNVPWNECVDYFALGIIFCEMINNVHPFGPDLNTIEENVVNLRYTLPAMSMVAESFVKQLLCCRTRRLTASNIQKHSFLNLHIATNLTTYEPCTLLVTDIPKIGFVDNVHFFGDIPAVDEPTIVQVPHARRQSLNTFPNPAAILRLKTQLSKFVQEFATAKGSRVFASNNEYRVECGVCRRKFKANGQKRREDYTVNWNIQPFTRHFQKTHVN